MTEKKYYFLCGMPRCGNTLLSCILNQNPEIKATPLSNVANIFKELINLTENNIFKNFPDEKTYDTFLGNIFDSYYSSSDCKYVIDRSNWGTPYNMKILDRYCPNEIKIVCLERNILEILTSFVRCYPDYISGIMKEKDIEEYCDWLMRPNGQITQYQLSFSNLRENYSSNYSLFINYNHLVLNTKEVIYQIYDFLNIPEYKNHYFKNISQLEINNVRYDDKILKMGELHKINKETVKKTNYSLRLPDSVIEKYGKI